MYVCGPTVYNYIHIGNARPLVFFDTVRRYLEYKNYNVKFVMNLTDIDDKIIDKANEEGVEFTDITKTYIAAFLKNAEDFNVDVDKIIKPQATNYIDDMINFISDLEKQGAAYDASTTVYFNIDSAENYGKLSKKNIEELELGSRIDVSGDKKILWILHYGKNKNILMNLHGIVHGERVDRVGILSVLQWLSQF